MGLPENTALLLNSIDKKSDNKSVACVSNAPSHSFMGLCRCLLVPNVTSKFPFRVCIKVHRNSKLFILLLYLKLCIAPVSRSKREVNFPFHFREDI